MNDSIKSIRITDIITDAGTQVRAELSEATVVDYTAQMLEGVKFPPVVVFHHGSRFILADGFHRVMAAIRAGFLDILAEVRLGGKPEALRYALQANVKHGLPRSNADKRNSVKLAIQQWPERSSNLIAKSCAVSHTLVDSVRSQLANSASCGDEPATRTGADGKARKPRTVKAVEPEQNDESVGQSDATASGHSEVPHVQTAAEELVAAFGGIEPDELVDNILAGFSRDVRTVSGMEPKHRVRVALALREMAEGLEQ